RPWRTGTYEKGAEQEDIDNLTAMLEGLSTSGVATHPNSTSLQIHWPAGGVARPGHKELFDTVAGEMSKCVLGQTATTDQNGGAGLSAGNEVHANVDKKKRNANAKAVAADIDRDFVGRLYSFNFDPSIRRAHFRFVTEDPADLEAFAKVIASLAKDA